MRIFLFHHMTWSVNSVCHSFGRRPFETSDESRNNWIVALPTFGEGWHNNHHAFPGSAIHGLGRRQVDVSWWTIRGLERLGLAWDVKVPTAERLAAPCRSGGVGLGLKARHLRVHQAQPGAGPRGRGEQAEGQGERDRRGCRRGSAGGWPPRRPRAPARPRPASCAG